MKRIFQLHGIAFVMLLAIATSNASAERILLQVEDFKGPWRKQTNIKGYLGKGFCTSNDTPNVAKTVMRKTAKVGKAGTYTAWIRAYTSENSNRAVQLEVGGKKLDVTHKGKKRLWNWERAGTVELPAGSVEVIVRDAADGFESVDAVLLTSDPREDPGEIERLWHIFGGDLPKQADAIQFNIDACLKFNTSRTDPKSKADWEARRPDLGVKLRKSMGLEPWPEKTPLEAQVTGRAEREGYTIENVVFQSLPKFYVTANVYKPKGKEGPLPAVVVTAGHAMEAGKNYDLYRQAQLGLVRQGFIVLAYDPIGQGERRKPGYSHPLSYPALLTGNSNLRYMVWDSVRALDYLLTRDDVDPQRIGLSGNSGGGLNTMYTMPVEERFAAGGTFCCLCSFKEFIEKGGNHCICNHLPGLCRDMEEFEFVGLCATRPFLAGNGAKDTIFPIAGVRNTVERAKRIYGFYGKEDAVALAEAPMPHGWSKPLREAAYGWFTHWLMARPESTPVAEKEEKLEPWESKDLQCFKDGKLPADAKSYVDMIREEAGRLIAAMPAAPKDEKARAKWTAAMRAKLWETLGGKPASVGPSAKLLGSFDYKGHKVERLAINTEPNMMVPGLLLRSKNASNAAPAVVLLDDIGKHAARNSPLVDSLLEQGVHVLAIDPRAIGEGRVLLNHCASDAVLIGRPLLAQQAWDVIAAARWLGGRKDVAAERIAVVGRGQVGLIATLAGALGDEISATVAEGSLHSFMDAIADPLPQPEWAYAANILKVADVPQLAAMFGPRKILQLKNTGGNDTKIVEFLMGRGQ